MSFLIEQGGTLILGSTVVLAIACIAVALSRAPIHQKRIGELAVWGVLALLALSTVPLPRLLMPEPHRSVAELAGSTQAPEPVPVRQASAPPADPGSSVEGAQPRGVDAEVGRPVNRETPTRDPRTEVVPLPPVAFRAAVESASWLDSLDPLDTLVGIYLAGVALCLLWLLAGALYLLVLLGRAKPAPAWVVDLLPDGPGPKVVVTPYRCRPFCIGWRRGRIVLPARLVQRERQDRIRQVLLHEVGHLRQADLGGQLPSALLLPVLFFNPLFWWLRARMRLASELLADDWAARRSTRAVYARELIALAEEDAGHGPAPLGAACIFRSTSEFYRRIKMLMEREETLSLRCSRWRNVLQTSVAAVVVVGLSSLGGVTAQDRVGETIQAIRKQLEVLQKENESLRSQLAQATGGKVADFFPGVQPGQVPPGLPPDPSLLADFVARVAEESFPGLVGAKVADESPESLLGSLMTPGALAEPPAPALPDESWPGSAGLPQAESYRPPQGPIVDTATLQLLNQAIDLQAEIESAEEELKHLQPLFDRDLVEAREVNQARRELQASTRKYELVRRMIHAEIEVTQQEVDFLGDRRNQYAKDSTPYRELQGQLERLLRRLEILSSVR